MSGILHRPGVRLTVGLTKLCCAWHLFATHGFQVGPADGPSMLPTFSTYGDWIGTDKRFRRGRGVRVGDLVLYKMPFAAHDMGVKRVVGLPGDYVSIGTPGQPGEENMIQTATVGLLETT
ncbi:Peptidase S24/S26A/S26B/S26C [Cordyceps fumosorosea ARSEF 2679]|uniref:Peptidase S24/S26A/S26B/S26C n=1 Tax=Cordyceps fumosorosea (strain ARSEF 2679) TaxID=1081104 RepID=A0A167Q172_CORFA|nr:Peptidase S24/S26A/S26B/S26C [Cordyceps fumosorosea ARSEF 2679]OAA57188.1 Peptidase S24/S26A/S26B/S26C [Cordyceps fumosorosea ARSEF 2679]